MRFDEIAATPAWRCVDFISDLHLQESEPDNFLAWRNYLEHSPADAIFILGDLFEVWVGDDVLMDSSQSTISVNDQGLNQSLNQSISQVPSFEDRCARVLHASAQQRAMYFMHGNRDFLVGTSLARACGMQILEDPSVLSFGGQRYLLSHGDALCLSDEPYQKFRAMVRSEAWQAKFLATPLQERLGQARAMRSASEARKQDLKAAGQAWVDIDQEAAVKWMDASQTQHLIHGHTHEGTDHAITSAQGQGTRHVLPDWCVTASSSSPARGYVLRLSLNDDGAVSSHHVALV